MSGILQRAKRQIREQLAHQTPRTTS